MKPKTKRALEDGGLGLIGWGISAALTYALLSKKSSAPAATGAVNGTGEMGALAPMGFSVASSIGDIVGKLKRVREGLSSSILKASSLSGTPVWLILCIVANEIGFAPFNRVNPAVKATGPGQITPPTLYAIYYFASTWKVLSPQMEAFFARKMGGDYAAFRKMALSGVGSNPALASRYLLDTEFNVAACSLMLKCLIRLYTSNGGVDYARLVYSYNQGIDNGIKPLLKVMGLSRQQLIARVAKPDWQLPAEYVTSPQALRAIAPTSESRNYIANHLARGGYFDQVRAMGLMAAVSMV